MEAEELHYTVGRMGALWEEWGLCAPETVNVWKMYLSCRLLV